MSLFSGKSAPDPTPTAPSTDRLLSDLLRGEEGRHFSQVYQSHGYFEEPERLAEIGFQDHSGQNFLGIVGGNTERILRPDGRPEYVTHGGTPIGLTDDRHRTLIAGSRSGKGRSCIIPELLTNKGSTIVIDPKGELASITARYRAEAMGHSVSIIDPFRITPNRCEEYRKQFNPLAEIGLENPTAIEDCGLIADALVVSQNSKDSHWDETAKMFIEAVLLHVAYGEAANKKKNLIYVAELIAGKQGKPFEQLLDEMMEMGGPDDRSAAGAIAMREKGTEERGSVLSNVRKNLKFLDYDAMRHALSHSDFSLGDLKKKPMTIYLVLPATRLSTCKQLLRLFVNMTLAAIEKSSERPEYPVQLILDEMAVLGHMRELENAIGQMAGLGLRITSVLQDIGQLKALYKDRYETFLGNSGIIQCFGIVDYQTSEWISKYLGKTTIRVAERNSTSVEQKNKGQSGVNYRTHHQELMSPEEVRRYFARDDHMNRQLICIPGKRPWITSRVHYDSHSLFAGRFDGWR
ncbi:MAG: type IV secretory system conjugative DNA transfer family protein [Verrucomicrobiota bacterium]